MKKTLVLAMIAVAAIACKKNETPVALAAGNEMNVVTSIGNGTKTAVDGVALPDGAAIGVHLLEGTDLYTPGANSKDYITQASTANIMFKQSAGSWFCNSPLGVAGSKVTLTAQTGTAYAYYPFTATVTGVEAAATVPVTTVNNATSDIAFKYDAKAPYATVAEEKDFMWATTAATPLNATNTTATFAMKHALSRVSFVITKGGDYGAGQALEAKSFEAKGFIVSGDDLPLAPDVDNKTVMNITTGAITGSIMGGRHSRTVSGYDVKISDDAKELDATELAAIGGFGCLILPTPATKTTQLKFEVSVVVDGKAVSFSVNAPAPVQYLAGTHYVYQLHVTSLTSLSVNQVTVAPWTETAGGKIDID